MAARSKKLKPADPINPADLANITKANPYIQRLIEDAELRENVQQAVESSKSAYTRLANGKAPHKALMEDKKLQGDLRNAFEAARGRDRPVRGRGRGGRGRPPSSVEPVLPPAQSDMCLSHCPNSSPVPWGTM